MLVCSGGHSGVTIVPLLSQTSVGKGVDGEAYKALVKRIQFGGDGALEKLAGNDHGDADTGRFCVFFLRVCRGCPGQGWCRFRHLVHGLR